MATFDVRIDMNIFRSNELSTSRYTILELERSHNIRLNHFIKLMQDSGAIQIALITMLATVDPAHCWNLIVEVLSSYIELVIDTVTIGWWF